MKPKLTVQILQSEAKAFAQVESSYPEPTLYGVTDGKAVGTYLEHKFQAYLDTKYDYVRGSSAKGIDFPDLQVDMKVTSIDQPQSSCPFTSGRQKIFGLGYSLVVFVYHKTDDSATQTGKLSLEHTIYIEARRTADYQMTTGLLAILKNNGNREELIAFMADKMLPVDEIEASRLADEILATPPGIGYLTISNALQWRLQYGRVITEADKVDGIVRIR